MSARVLLVSLSLFLLMACDKKEDDTPSGKSYSGRLTFVLSRTFPTLHAETAVDVSIDADGNVGFSQPEAVYFEAVSEKIMDGDRIKLTETGVIQVSAISGNLKSVNGKDYLVVALNMNIDGNLTHWDYRYPDWICAGDDPYTVSDPVSCPLMFRMENALMDEALCGHSCCNNWGNTCYRWKLVLQPA